MARPTKRIPAVESAILQAIRGGMTRTDAFELHGVNRVQCWRWMRRFPAFREAVVSALAHAEVRTIQTVHVERRMSRDQLTPSGYAAMLERQGRRCAICGSDEPGMGYRKLVIDHDHATGAIRGLLCGSCNFGLGNFRDDPSLLGAAIRYLAEMAE